MSLVPVKDKYANPTRLTSIKKKNKKKSSGEELRDFLDAGLEKYIHGSCTRTITKNTAVFFFSIASVWKLPCPDFYLGMKK